jgi:hypothetical protein
MAGSRVPTILTALAFGAAAAATSAHAQGDLSDDPVVRAIQEPLVDVCRKRGLYPWFVPDFLSGTDAEGDGRGNDMLVDAAGFSCVQSPEGGEDATFIRPLCETDRICMRWLIVEGPQGHRLVWSGSRPNLFSMGEEGLINLDVECARPGCNRMIWNGRALVPAGQRR